MENVRALVGVSLEPLKREAARLRLKESHLLPGTRMLFWAVFKFLSCKVRLLITRYDIVSKRNGDMCGRRMNH